jgi:D-3-phosphoglycerate dehydrogenase
MRVTILDDYFDTVRTLPCFAKLAGHDVSIWNDHVQDVDQLAARLRDAEVLAVIRERTQIRRGLLEQLPRLRLISQRSVYPTSTLPTARGSALSCHRPTSRYTSYAAAELTFGLTSPRCAKSHNKLPR